MSILSTSFFVFCAILLVLYYTVFCQRQWIVLLIASAVFYLMVCKEQSWYILVTMIITYVSARGIFRAQSSTVDLLLAKRKARRILVAALIFTIGSLAFVKYLGFLLNSILHVTSWLGLNNSTGVELSLIAPIGISYYTFCVTAYLLDVYWKRIPAEKNPLKYTLFVLYFPQILQGPIPRYSQMSPQFYVKKNFDFERFRDGALQVLFGLFKKLVIANRLSIFLAPYFDEYQQYAGPYYILILILYSFYIYADFSGAIDIVSGISSLFGIRLPENFRRPYLAKTIPEFWQRWHISLSSWFKDYVFFPTSISKLAKKINGFTKKRWGRETSRTLSNLLPLFTVWFLTGLWHGASLNFILWGMYYFFLFALGTLFAKPITRIKEIGKMQTECFSFRMVQIIRTFLLCSFGRVFFRSPNAHAAGSIILRIFRDNTFVPEEFVSIGMLICYGAIAVLMLVDFLQEKKPVLLRLQRSNILFRWLVYFVLIFSVLTLGLYGSNAITEVFAYEQF